jgi:hypothetical protein
MGPILLKCTQDVVVQGLVTIFFIPRQTTLKTTREECQISGTRSHSNAFIEIRANYEQYKNSFLPRTITDWNSLSTHLVHVTSVDEFGSRLQSLTT